jgi:hypothetical protein
MKNKTSGEILTRRILFEKVEKTLKNWLADYYNGITVNTVSMGGLGDGYELAIQECAIEAMKNLQMIAVPESQEKFIEILNEAMDKASEELDAIHGFSGAQVGAAKSIAAVFWKKTPDEGMKTAPADRIIQIYRGSDGMARMVKTTEETKD